MTRFLFVLILTVATASSNAARWPWQDSPEEPLDYCQGFVVGGLASSQTQGQSRTSLWLAWNYIERSLAPDHSPVVAEYQAGRGEFLQITDAGNALSLLEKADGTCGLGRSGHQISGW